MIIESIYIKNFGKLADMKINLSDGVNILRGENESGKSTLCAFIRFVFYGLSGRAEEKLKYISWGASSVSGYIIANEGGKRYRIEREAVCSWDSDGKASVRERSAVIDCDLSQAVFRGQNAGEVFFGVPADVFESTVYVGQIGDSRIGGRAESIGGHQCQRWTDTFASRREGVRDGLIESGKSIAGKREVANYLLDESTII